MNKNKIRNIFDDIVCWNINVNKECFLFPNGWENITFYELPPEKQIQHFYYNRNDMIKSSQYVLIQHWNNCLLRVLNFRRFSDQHPYNIVEKRIKKSNSKRIFERYDWMFGNITIIEKLKIKNNINLKYKDILSNKKSWIGEKFKLKLKSNVNGYTYASLRKYLTLDKKYEFFLLRIWDRTEIIFNMEDLKRNEYIFTIEEYHRIKEVVVDNKL